MGYFIELLNNQTRLQPPTLVPCNGVKSNEQWFNSFFLNTVTYSIRYGTDCMYGTVLYGHGTVRYCTGTVLYGHGTKRYWDKYGRDAVFD